MLEIIICAVSGVVVGGIIGFLLCYFIPIFAKKRAEIKAEKIIKSAEICKATESPRWSRGEKKEAAQSWDEVSNILQKEGISPELIRIVANSYGKERFGKDQEESHTITEYDRQK